jgi:D-hydroxyproline dehydrogenase subunit gamma
VTSGATASTVTIWVNGKASHAIAGQSVAAALIERGVWACNQHAVTGLPRGPYCGMGVCFDCLVRVDGRTGVRSCMIRVHDGLRIETGDGEAGLAA